MAGEMGGGRWRQTSRRETAKEKKERVRVGGKKKWDLGEQGRAGRRTEKEQRSGTCAAKVGGESAAGESGLTAGAG